MSILNPAKLIVLGLFAIASGCAENSTEHSTFELGGIGQFAKCTARLNKSWSKISADTLTHTSGVQISFGAVYETPESAVTNKEFEQRMLKQPPKGQRVEEFRSKRFSGFKVEYKHDEDGLYRIEYGIRGENLILMVVAKVPKPDRDKKVVYEFIQDVIDTATFEKRS